MTLKSIKTTMTINDLTPDEVKIIQRLRLVDSDIRAKFHSFLADWLISQKERHQAARRQKFTVI